MTLTILLLLVGALVASAIIYKVNFTGQAAAKQPAGRGPDLTIENIGVGGVFSLRGVGAAMDDLDLTVEARHVYDEDGYRWTELECTTGDRKVWVTVERDDFLEVSITLRRVKPGELGIMPADLAEYRNGQAAELHFEQTVYDFESRGRATFHRDGDPAAGEAFRYWTFGERDGDRSITVEQWQDGSVEGHLSQALKSAQITVYSLSGAEA